MKDGWLIDESLAPYTTLRIGGKADYFCRASSTQELVENIKEARELGLAITVLGGGSNVLVSDKGVRGLVIHNEAREIMVGKTKKFKDSKTQNNNLLPRWQSDKERGTFKYEFSDLNYDESSSPRVKVIMESGVILPIVIGNLLDMGITGLQWYAKIPGTIGGAVFNNIHGGTHFISELVRKVKVLDKNNEVKILSGKELGLAYDKSRFHDSGEIILEVKFELFRGDVERARRVAFEWAKRKSLQPPRSAGCTFRNISNEDKDRLNLPTTSAGYIIEHVLKMGGYKIGGAKVSTAHHNFVVNDGGATAADCLAVIREIQKRTREELGIELEPEIFLLGEF